MYKSLLFLFIKVFTLVTFITFLIVFAFLEYRKIDFINELKVKESVEVEHLGLHVTHDLNEFIIDAEHVSQSPLLFSYLSTQSETSKKRLEDNLISLIKVNSVFDQIRVINDKGKEIFRVNYGDPPFAVPKGKLQDKSQRYYFKDLIKSDGNLKFSNFSLNVENGKVEVPHKPMIRVGKSIVIGERKFVIIFNFNGKAILNYIDSRGSTGKKIYLVSPDGHWLKGPKPDLEWGNSIFERAEETFQKRYFSLDSSASDEYVSQVSNEHGLFTFNIVKWSGNSVTLISHINNPHIFMHSLNQPDNLMFLCFSIIFVSLVITALKGRSLHYKAKARVIRQNLVQSKRFSSVSQLGAGMAHELNSPLTTLMGHVCYLQEQAQRGDLSIDDITFCTDELEKVGRKMVMIVDRVRQFSEYQSKSINTESSINKQIETFLYEKRLKNIKMGVSVDYKVSQDIPNAKIPPDEIYIVLNEVIENSIESYPRNLARKSITISTEYCSNYKAATITIQDKGRGVSSEHLEFIYDPFYSTKGTKDNKGLGLAICYGICEKYHGQFRLESKENMGTTVYVTLPTVN